MVSVVLGFVMTVGLLRFEFVNVGNENEPVVDGVDVLNENGFMLVVEVTVVVVVVVVAIFVAAAIFVAVGLVWNPNNDLLSVGFASDNVKLN